METHMYSYCLINTKKDDFIWVIFQDYAVEILTEVFISIIKSVR